MNKKNNYSKLTNEYINELPLKYFEGDIKIVRTKKELKNACDILKEECVLGFDTETRPSFKKGQFFLPSLIQLAGVKSVFIFQLKKCGFNERLIKILSDPLLIKCGVAVGQDIKDLQKMTFFEPNGFIDLGEVAQERNLKNYGLRNLTALLLRFRISKSSRTTNWSVNDLSIKQMEYAATDAWVSREIYFKLFS
ncbi:MAG: 3'-5' exonuclease [Candidatus Marinimicrobia bacterium]|nr:3'-5' exonuclease [Candidatus Neomarinimicrobiota bacterium]|tara:strand:+ start:856 stop:1437 length:582 start_codon:yes stop_codon:yes gene_type:complete